VSTTCCDYKAVEGPNPGPAPAPAAPRHITGDDCCAAKEGEIAALGSHADVRRVLRIVLAINLAMFFVEFTAGVLARSTALMADSVDMLGDALVYMLSLYALERGLRWRAGAALAKGAIIAAFGIWVFVEVVLKLIGGAAPTAATMGIFGLIALIANLTCLARSLSQSGREPVEHVRMLAERRDRQCRRVDRRGRCLCLPFGLAGRRRRRHHRLALLPVVDPRPRAGLAAIQGGAAQDRGAA
jgi:hypothetical protein